MTPQRSIVPDSQPAADGTCSTENRKRPRAASADSADGSEEAAIATTSSNDSNARLLDSILLNCPDALVGVLLFAGHHGTESLRRSCRDLCSFVTTERPDVWRHLALSALERSPPYRRDGDTKNEYETWSSVSDEAPPVDMADWRAFSSLLHCIWDGKDDDQCGLSGRVPSLPNDATPCEKAGLRLRGIGGGEFPMHWYWRETRKLYTENEKDVLAELVHRRETLLAGWLNSIVRDLLRHRPGTSVECSGTVSADPGLYVPALDESLTLPLRPDILQRLIDSGCCGHAPHGGGTETVVDLTARKCWKMDLSKDALITNPSFISAFTRSGAAGIAAGPMDEMKAHLAPHLFASGGEIVAQPYQLLIYEEGGMFKKRRDTLRGPTNCGSCVISLPVEGEAKGGALVLEHKGTDGKLLRVEHGPATVAIGTENRPKWIAFFTDVLHEVEPIESGYRVALTYHLWSAAAEKVPWPVGSSFSDADLAGLHKAAGLAIQHWVEANYMPAHVRFAIALEHQSSDPETLRGRDRTLYKSMKDSFRGTRMECWLEDIQLEKEEPRGECDGTKIFVVSATDEGKVYTNETEDHTVWLNRGQLAVNVDLADPELYELCYTRNARGTSAGLIYTSACIYFDHVDYRDY